jgi:hypothetical protein
MPPALQQRAYAPHSFHKGLVPENGYAARSKVLEFNIGRGYDIVSSGIFQRVWE